MKSTVILFSLFYSSILGCNFYFLTIFIGSLLVFLGQVLDCSLAKPQADQKSSGVQNLQKSALLPTYPPHLGFGMVGGAYGALGAGFGGAGFGQVRCPFPTIRRTNFAWFLLTFSVKNLAATDLW